MTVNECIKQLQELVAQGRGNQSVQIIGADAGLSWDGLVSMTTDTGRPTLILTRGGVAQIKNPK